MALLQTLLRAFARGVGIEELEFDADGRAHLSFENIEIEIECDGKHNAVIVSAPIGELPAQDSPAFFRSLLHANLALGPEGFGMIGLAGSDELIFFNRIATGGLSQQQFDEVMGSTFHRMQALRDQFAQAPLSYAKGAKNRSYS